MILNKMQKAVINSQKRVIVVTAQAGSGTTAALITKLMDEAAKNSSNIGIFLRRTTSQVMSHVQQILKENPKARYSSASNILTTVYKGKEVKIKFLGLESLDLCNYIPLIAIDQASHFTNIADIVNTSGKIVISDFISQVEEKDSWAYSSGLLEKSGPVPVWRGHVDHIIGHSHDNPGLSPEYMECLYGLDERDISRLMRVKFKTQE